MNSLLVRSGILVEYRRLAIALDLDSDALMKRSGIDLRLLEDSELMLPMRQVVDLLEITAVTSGIDDFGLQLGGSRGLPDLGAVILMLREEESIRHALRTLVSVLHLHSDALFMTLDERDPPILTIEIIGGGMGRCRHAIESSIASLTTILRWLLGDTWNATSVAFTHARPASLSRYQRFFHCPIDFHQDFNGIVLAPCDLDKRLPRSSPVLKRQIERLLASINVAPTETYSHRVTQVIAMALPRGEASADVVANYLGTDRRTLNRRLSRSGLNYSQALNAVRKSLAEQYMLGSERPLTDIAGLVGFESLSTFSRWFSEHFAQAPAAWRKTRKGELMGVASRPESPRLLRIDRRSSTPT